jgi:hypothetical protein
MNQNKGFSLYYKSEGEKKIGAYLDSLTMNYTYEKPVAVVYDGKTKLFYPDFHLDDFKLIIEYFGMNGDTYNAKINDYKRKVYLENKFDLIEIYPTDFRKDWKEIINKGIHDTLEKRIAGYVTKTGRAFPPLYLNGQYDDMKF